MMPRAIITIFAVFLSVAVARAHLNWELSDAYYCGPYLSCNGTDNVMCHKRTVFGPDCHDPQYILINEHLKEKILGTHNELRNNQAMGINEQLLKHQVTNMATMSWDNELELMSLINVMQCKMSKDECVRTSKYKRVGQNLYELCSSSNYSPTELVIDWAIRSWFDAHHTISNLDEIKRVSEAAIETSEQFLQVVKSNADRIGCAAVKYLDARNYRCTLVGCNYNTGNVIGYPTYEMGVKASDCTTGVNPKYKGLCSENEDYTKHPNADVYFGNEWPPIVTEWLNHQKSIDAAYNKKV